MRIPFNRAPLDYAEAQPYLQEAIENGWLTTGPLTRRFTDSLQNYLGTENILALASCTAALQIALRLADIPAGSEVILPSNTFVATLETVELAGLIPVLADIEPHDWNISPQSAREKITQKTKAIIAVPFAGASPDMAALQEITKAHELTLILDSAHALETSFKSKRIHTYADYTALSFYATKNLTTAEGGALIVPEDQLERARGLSLHGMSRAAWNRYAGGSWKYDILETGYKSNLTDIHAALGLAQLPHLDRNHTRRVELARQYRRALDGLPLRFQNSFGGNEHAAHLCCVLVGEDSPISRDQIIDALRSRDIGFSVHFIPLYHFTSVEKYQRFKAIDFPENEAYFHGAVSLPLYPTLTDLEQSEIIETIRSLFVSSAVASVG